MSTPAIVLYSGGMDSTLCLALAHEAGFGPIIALSFQYGQKHDVAAPYLRRTEHWADWADGGVSRVILKLPTLGGCSSSLVENHLEVPKGKDPKAAGIPNTYVPARNLVFLAHAVSLAEDRGIKDIFIGANQLDFSGYPDCRDMFFGAFTAAATMGTKAYDEGAPFHIHRPLINMTKADIVRKGLELGVDFGNTMSCYQPCAKIHHRVGEERRAGFADGRLHACGECDSCQLRLAAFNEVGVEDPVPYVNR